VSSAEYEKLLTPAECAAIWKVDPKTITRWAKAGKLTAIRTLGGHRRYREAEVLALLRRPSEAAEDALAAPVHTLWPVSAAGGVTAVKGRLRGAGVFTVGNLAGLSAADLRDIGLSPAQLDEVRLALFKKGLALRGEILGDVA